MAVPVWPISSWPPGLSTSICSGSALRRRVDDAGVVHVMRTRAASDRRGRESRAPRPSTSRATRRVGAGTCACSSTRSVRTIRKSGAPSSYDAPSVAMTSATRPAIGARSTNALPAAAPPPVRSVSSRCASRASAARSRASATVDGAPRVLDAPRRDGALGQQPFGARLLGARGLERRLRLGDLGRRASRDRRRPASRGSRRPSACPARTRSPIDGSASARESSGGRRGDDRLAARQRLDRRRHANRRPQLGLAAPAPSRTRSSTAVPSGRRSPPDRPAGCFSASAMAACFVGEDGDRAEVVAIGQSRRVDDERPAIASGRGRRAFDAERAGPRRLRARQRRSARRRPPA